MGVGITCGSSGMARAQRVERSSRAVRGTDGSGEKPNSLCFTHIIPSTASPPSHPLSPLCDLSPPLTPLYLFLTPSFALFSFCSPTSFSVLSQSHTFPVPSLPLLPFCLSRFTVLPVPPSQCHTAHIQLTPRSTLAPIAADWQPWRPAVDCGCGGSSSSSRCASRCAQLAAKPLARPGRITAPASKLNYIPSRSRPALPG